MYGFGTSRIPCRSRIRRMCSSQCYLYCWSRKLFQIGPNYVRATYFFSISYQLIKLYCIQSIKIWIFGVKVIKVLFQIFATHTLYSGKICYFWSFGSYWTLTLFFKQKYYLSHLYSTCSKHLVWFHFCSVSALCFHLNILKVFWNIY